MFSIRKEVRIKTICIRFSIGDESKLSKVDAVQQGIAKVKVGGSKDKGDCEVENDERISGQRKEFSK